jgi:hypothetical protein
MLWPCSFLSHENNLFHCTGLRLCMRSDIWSTCITQNSKTCLKRTNSAIGSGRLSQLLYVCPSLSSVVFVLDFVNRPKLGFLRVMGYPEQWLNVLRSMVAIFNALFCASKSLGHFLRYDSTHQTLLHAKCNEHPIMNTDPDVHATMACDFFSEDSFLFLGGSKIFT